ncbi:Tom37 metaxin N-terminal-like domain-containing protein [Yoonia sp. BS5-3]|uniref:Tom37 metaxin N-terminal-like domain-containing protein n=1 Tax=Yoonia phaeophyticola TaxID=3137369 RepID=A0ABZ2V779_9RHOB
MITLITYEAGFGQPSFSPFCVKAMWLLQAADAQWQREDSNDPRKFPQAKLPAIRVPEGIIGDSHNIQIYLEERGADFWGAVTDKASGHAFIRMAEEHMYFHLVLDRWANDQLWPIIRENYFAAIPKLLRRPITSSIRKETLRGMKAQGLGRLTPEERLKRIAPDLAAIKARLDAHPYLMGPEISLPDYSVAAMLCAMMATPLPTLLQERITDDPVLSAYAMRVAERMTPA